MERESMEFDVLVVGAGPAGLSAAIRRSSWPTRPAVNSRSACSKKVQRLAATSCLARSWTHRPVRALSRLAGHGRPPLHTPVTEDRFLFLTPNSAYKTPQFLLPGCFKNHGNYVVSLSDVVKWLGQQAENLGIDVYPGFAAAEVLYNDEQQVIGVATGDMGIGKDGQPTDQYARGMALYAKYTLFAEGSRGHLGKQLIHQFKLDAQSDPQSYGIGLKELWEVPAAQSQPGLVIHTAGWPLDRNTYGGSFLYHLKDNKVAVGFVVGLNYKNPWLSPFEESSATKPTRIAEQLSGASAWATARGHHAGGLNSLPKLVFPGAHSSAATRAF